MKTWHRQDPKLFDQEGLLLTAAEQIWEIMECRKVSKADLAKVLGCSRAHVTMVLNGTRNMTLRTLSDLAGALQCDVEVRLVMRAKRKRAQGNSEKP